MWARIAGTMLATLAAALLVSGAITSNWWSGNLREGGRVMISKIVHIGLIEARLCFTKGTEECRVRRHIDSKDKLFADAGMATGGTGLATALLLVMIALGWAIGSRSRWMRGLGWLGLLMAVASGGAGAAFIALRPPSADVPLGYSGALFFAGAIAGVGAAVTALTRRALSAVNVATRMPRERDQNAVPVGVSAPARGAKRRSPEPPRPEPRLARGSPANVELPRRTGPWSAPMPPAPEPARAAWDAAPWEAPAPSPMVASRGAWDASAWGPSAESRAPGRRPAPAEMPQSARSDLAPRGATPPSVEPSPPWSSPGDRAITDVSSVDVMMDPSPMDPADPVTGTSSVEIVTGTSSIEIVTGTSSVELLTGTSSVELLTGTSSVELLTGSSVELLTGASSEDLLAGISSSDLLNSLPKPPPIPRPPPPPPPAGSSQDARVGGVAARFAPVPDLAIDTPSADTPAVARAVSERRGSDSTDPGQSLFEDESSVVPAAVSPFAASVSADPLAPEPLRSVMTPADGVVARVPLRAEELTPPPPMAPPPRASRPSMPGLPPPRAKEPTPPPMASRPSMPGLPPSPKEPTPLRAEELTPPPPMGPSPMAPMPSRAKEPTPPPMALRPPMPGLPPSPTPPPPMAPTPRAKEPTTPPPMAPMSPRAKEPTAPPPMAPPPRAKEPTTPPPMVPRPLIPGLPPSPMPPRAKEPTAPPPTAPLPPMPGLPSPPTGSFVSPFGPPRINLPATLPAIPPAPGQRGTATNSPPIAAPPLSDLEPETDREGRPPVQPAPEPPARTSSIEISLDTLPACPHCDAPTVWNEEHLRFYCGRCRIYL